MEYHYMYTSLNCLQHGVLTKDCFSKRVCAWVRSKECTGLEVHKHSGDTICTVLAYRVYFTPKDN